MSDQYYYQIPASLGVQGGKTFYLATLPARVLVKLLRLDNGPIETRAQRAVNPSRVNRLYEYLINEQDYFLPSVTGVIDTKGCVDDLHFIPSELTSMVGHLNIPMDASILLGDGQHRASGLAKAIADKADLGQQSVPIMLYVDLTLSQRRQMFTDINQNASKPSRAICDTFNQRSPLLNVVTDAINLVPNLSSCVEFESNSVSEKLGKAVSIKTLVEAAQILTGYKRSTKSINEDLVEYLTEAFEVLMYRLSWHQKPPYLSTKAVFIRGAAMAAKNVYNCNSSFNALAAWQGLDLEKDSAAFSECFYPNGKIISGEQSEKKIATILSEIAGCRFI